MKSNIVFAPVGQLSPQPWLKSDDTVQILSALMVSGTDVRFIGGCVRDGLLQIPVKDIDLATPLKPQEVMSLLQGAGIKAIPTGIDHGTITAIATQGGIYEITTLRRDVETDGRHATVSFSDDWYADAARRDFTINALSADPEGVVYDYFNGLQDLGSGIVRFIGRPEQRLEEDILRLLRFFRFSAFYTHGGQVDPHGLASCRLAAPRLVELSGERIAQELFRLLAAPDPSQMLLIMRGLGILDFILPDMQNFGVLKILQWLETKAMVRPHLQLDPIRRLAATLRPNKEDGYELPNRLHLSNAQSDRLFALANLPRPSLDTTILQLRHMLHNHGADILRDLTLLAWADERACGVLPSIEDNQKWIGILDEVDAWQPKKLPIDGKDYLHYGGKAGPECGHSLRKVEKWWIDENFCPDRKLCLKKLKEIMGV